MFIQPEADPKINNKIELPFSFTEALLIWPELKPLLESFAHRDPGTFMHCIAVHFATNRLAQDLILFLQPGLVIQNAIHHRAHFSLFHDLGKTAADINQETAQKLVHPFHKVKRPTYDTARHWIHPVMGGHMLETLAKTIPNHLQPIVKKWAQLTYFHDWQLNPFLDFDSNKFNWLDRFSLFIFSLCDTTMAMGLPRPNKGFTQEIGEIKAVLNKNHLQDQHLKQLFTNQNLEQLKHYVIISILSSLQELKKKYPYSAWIQPPGFNNQNFNFTIRTNEQKTQILDNLVKQAWQKYESDWEKVMMQLNSRGVL